jgi:hypothetical protein
MPTRNHRHRKYPSVTYTISCVAQGKRYIVQCSLYRLLKTHKQAGPTGTECSQAEGLTTSSSPCYHPCGTSPTGTPSSTEFGKILRFRSPST